MEKWQFDRFMYESNQANQTKQSIFGWAQLDRFSEKYKRILRLIRLDYF